MSLSDHRLSFRRIQLYIEPRDAWVGVYVDPKAVYVCPLPFVVVRWTRVNQMYCPDHPLWKPLRYDDACLWYTCTIKGCPTIVHEESLIEREGEHDE